MGVFQSRPNPSFPDISSFRVKCPGVALIYRCNKVEGHSTGGVVLFGSQIDVRCVLLEGVGEVTFGILDWVLSLHLMSGQRTSNHYCSQLPQNNTTCSKQRTGNDSSSW